MMIRLFRPDIALAPGYLDCMGEMSRLGEKVWEANLPRAEESIERFIERLRRAETDPEPGKVAETQYWAVRDGFVVGRIALRHELNANLKEFGGHIGYEVRPSARRAGVATEMLRLVLQEPKARELNDLLLTCAPDNFASNRTIQKNGGVLEKSAFVEKWNRQTNYYWIRLS